MLFVCQKIRIFGYVCNWRSSAAGAFFRPQFYSPNVSELLIQIDEQEATVVPAGLVDELSEFRGAGEWARLISEPVYRGFGEHEFPTSFREEPSAH